MPYSYRLEICLLCFTRIYLLFCSAVDFVMLFYFDMLTRSEFPTLSSQSRSSMTKDQSPANRQKSQAGKVSSAAPANTSRKVKAEASNKQTGIVAGFFFSCL